MISIVGINPVFTKASEFVSAEVVYTVAIAFAAVVFVKLLKNYLFSVSRHQEDLLQTSPISVKFSFSVMRKWMDRLVNSKKSTYRLDY